MKLTQVEKDLLETSIRQSIELVEFQRNMFKGSGKDIKQKYEGYIQDRRNLLIKMLPQIDVVD